MSYSLQFALSAAVCCLQACSGRESSPPAGCDLSNPARRQQRYGPPHRKQSYECLKKTSNVGDRLQTGDDIWTTTSTSGRSSSAADRPVIPAGRCQRRRWTVYDVLDCLMFLVVRLVTISGQPRRPADVRAAAQT